MPIKGLLVYMVMYKLTITVVLLCLESHLYIIE